MQTDSQGCTPRREQMRYPLSTAGLAPAQPSSHPWRIDVASQPHHFAAWLDGALLTFCLPPGTQGSPCRRTCSEEASSCSYPEKNMTNYPAVSQCHKEEGRGCAPSPPDLHLLLALEDVLKGAPPKLEGLCVPSCSNLLLCFASDTPSAQICFEGQ